MEKIFICLGILILTISLGGFLVCVLYSKLIDIDLYFLRFDLDKHPVLIQMLKDLTDRICKEENIPVFNKTFEEVNKNREKQNHTLGLYKYTLDAEYQQQVNNKLMWIIKLETSYGQPIEELCENLETKINKEKYMLPRIILCEDELRNTFHGSLGYYSTYLHEIGHHFALKQGLFTEYDADDIAADITINNLPYFFQLIPQFNYQYELDLPDLTTKQKIRAYIEYYKYYRKHKSTILK